MRPNLSKSKSPTKKPAEQVVKDIRRATRRHFSAEDKIRIVLDGLRGEDSIAELCRSALGERAIAKAWDAVARLKAGGFNDMNRIRSIEGEAASAYWAAWVGIEMRWTAQTRYPVPESWHRYHSRSSILTGHKKKNRKASHPINAMLNYAYAVRAAQLQIQAVADGFDPNAGIMHHYRDDFPAYVYDLIEPERPKVDAAILPFAQCRTFSGADFILRKDGACRLSPQLARTVATLLT